ncbi:MAG: helix-hairpin-helix domain-containing protein [Pseudomonadota bacterium]
MTSFKSTIALFSLALSTCVAVQAKDVPKPASPATEAPAVTAKAKAAAMDINTASATDLATLPKIGEARAAAIVKGRPYKAKDELLQKKILTNDAYASVKDLIIAKQAPAGK